MLCACRACYQVLSLSATYCLAPMMLGLGACVPVQILHCCYVLLAAFPLHHQELAVSAVFEATDAQGGEQGAAGGRGAVQ